MMTKSVFVCASIFALGAAIAPARASDCASRIHGLDASNAEGQQRLDEKNEVIGLCANQYKRDQTIGRLVKACDRYEEQPVVKQQSVAECQIAAFNYANALRWLRSEYGK